jgi:cold-inducible RNA-binding protein
MWEMFPPTSNGYADVELEHTTVRLYVGSLPYNTTDQDLADLFGQIGQVLSATVITDRDSGRSKGFGFVEMSSDDEARTAIDQLNGANLGNRTIVVNEARERRDQSSGGGNRFQSRGRRPGGGGRDGGYRDRDGGYRDRRY